MKRSTLNENNFEVKHVTKTLVDSGYIERLPENYNQALFLYPEIIFTFISNVVTGKAKVDE